MRACDLAVAYPSVKLDSDALDAARLCQAPAGRRVADCLPGERRKPPIADPEDTALEVAALMAREHGPLIAVVERGPGRERGGSRLLGVITAAHLTARLLGVT
jgi:CBS domain-containing protein